MRGNKRAAAYLQDVEKSSSEGNLVSTKSSIKWKDNTDDSPGYHLYEDVFDYFEKGDPPVYLRLDGVAVEISAPFGAGASVTVTIPRATARELGLLPADNADQKP